ncbi:polysaccharide lyase [Natronococcus jeotgali]|uniref:polysaccharide lyase n=1 Tax=Natronococcus jeotgali TaxID=413812 RepID=UPI001EF9D556|nr:hypothetical protein [Natronococcus jeotgali]
MLAVLLAVVGITVVYREYHDLEPRVELGDEGTPESEPEPQFEVIDLPEDGQGQTGHSNLCGVAIVPDRDLKALEVRLGGDRHDGAKVITAIHVYDDEETPLATKQTAGLDHGDWVAIEYDFSAGQEYRILLDGEGEQYVRYRAEASCPYEGDGLTVINGSYSPSDDSQTENYVYNIDRIRGSLAEGIDESEPDYRNIELSEVASDENASIADDPAGGMRPVASIDCQEGKPEHYSVETRWELEDLVGHEPDVVHFRYQIYFPTHFEFHQSMNHGGTKLPGPADHRGGGAAGGSHNPGEAWSARGYATTHGPNDATEDGSDIPLGKQVYDVTGASKDYGHMHSWKRGANKGEWVTIDERYEMGEPGEFDSRIAAWINARKAFDRDDYQFVDEDHGYKGVHEWRWHFYFGGRWGSPKEQSKYVRRFGVWTGDNCPELEDLE